MRFSDMFSSRFLLAVLTVCLSLVLHAEALNVKDFGAVGDGVTDDTVAIQKALNQVEADNKASRTLYCNDRGRIPGWGVYDSPNREIFFPAGTYRITRTLVGGRSVTLTGEPGSVICADDPELIILYLHNFFRGSVRRLTFRGGKNHLYYWSANQDTTSLVVENCRFEDASGYAVTSRSYGVKHKAAHDQDWDRIEPAGPFKVTWDGDGMPTLSPGKWDIHFANSTKFILDGCEFINCAGGSDVVADGTFISDCVFESDKPQRLAPFVGAVGISNCRITADIPEDFDQAFLGRGTQYANGIIALSTSEYGAPLLFDDRPFRSEVAIKVPWPCVIENCVVSAANSWCGGAVAYFPKARPVQFTMRNTREASGEYVQALGFAVVPQNDADLMEDQIIHTNPNIKSPPVEDSHRFVFQNNGPEIDICLPANMMRFIEPDLPEDFRASFPEPGRALIPRDLSECKVFDAEDFGIGHEASADDFKNLGRLFAEAAEVENPLILLPGRAFELPEALSAPARCVIRGEGRVFFHVAEGKSALKFAGDDLDVELIGILFNGGADTLAVSGAGSVRIDDCLFYDCRGAVSAEQTGEKPLVVDVFASTFICPVAATNRNGEFRITNSWIEISPTLEKEAALCNLGDGVMIAENICGVPVVFGAWCELSNWPYGHDIWWVENHGIYRSRGFRYGGEFNGIPVVDNRGAGQVLIEFSMAAFWNHESARVLLGNESSEARFGIGSVGSLGNIGPGIASFCRGEVPGVFLVSSYPYPEYLTVTDDAGEVSPILY